MFTHIPEDQLAANYAEKTFECRYRGKETSNEVQANESISELDRICSELGGINVAQLRGDRMNMGSLLSINYVGNNLVVNRSNQGVNTTKVVAEKGKLNQDLIKTLEQYYSQ